MRDPANASSASRGSFDGVERQEACGGGTAEGLSRIEIFSLTIERAKSRLLAKRNDTSRSTEYLHRCTEETEVF